MVEEQIVVRRNLWFFMSHTFQIHQTALTLGKSDRRAQRAAYDVLMVTGKCGQRFLFFGQQLLRWIGTGWWPRWPRRQLSKS